MAGINSRISECLFTAIAEVANLPIDHLNPRIIYSTDQYFPILAYWTDRSVYWDSPDNQRLLARFFRWTGSEHSQCNFNYGIEG